MRKDSEKEKPELQWIENLVELALLMLGALATGLLLALVAGGAAAARLWVKEPPPSGEEPKELS